MYKPFHILSMGSIYLDINCAAFPFPESGLTAESETVGGDYQAQLGGSAVISARVGAQLGLKTAFIGKTGNDYFGNLLKNLLEKEHIEAALIASPEHQTNIGLHYTSPQGQVIMTTVGSANQSLNSNDVLAHLEHYMPLTEYFYIGGYFKLKTLSPFYPEIVAMAKKYGTKLILDHGRINNSVTENQKNILRSLLPAIDIYLPSKDEFCTLWEVQSIQDGLKKVSDLSSATIIVKDSQNGAMTIEKGELVSIPSVPVVPIQSVGAGDSFNAGFIKGQMVGYDLKKSIQFASATAALKISQIELPTVEQVENLLQSKYVI